MFESKSTREIVAGKRPATEELAAETKVTGKTNPTPTTAEENGSAAGKPEEELEETQTKAKHKKIPKWGFVAAGVALIMALTFLALVGMYKQNDAVDSYDYDKGVIAADADAGVISYVKPGDVVRIYDAQGQPIEALQYVRVHNVGEQLLLEVDKLQAAALVTMDINPKMVVVAHDEREKATQMLTLQARINDPSITLTLQDAVNLKPGESLQLEIESVIDPVEATLPPIQWTTSDPAVATVDENGSLYAAGLGEAMITASCGKVKAECKITVAVPLEAIGLGQTEVVLGIGETVAVSAAPQPENATAFAVAWTSADPDVATVDENGTITAVASGTTTVTAASGSVTAECQVTVGNRADVVKLDATELTLKVSETRQLTGTVYPEGDVIDVPGFSSSNPGIASVSEDGVITAVAPGSCTIRFICGNAEASCTITVTK